MRVVSYQSLRDELVAILPAEVQWGPGRDRSYVRPSKRWAELFASWCWLNAPPYKAEGRDCDNRADWLREEARKSREAGGIELAETALVTTDIIVPPWNDGSNFLNIDKSQMDDFGGHETNLIATDKDGWFFVDPNSEALWSLIDALNNDLCVVAWCRL